METIYPLIFNESLTDAQLAEKECGDGIYVSINRFSTFMNDDNEELVTLAVKKGGVEITTHICGTHGGDSEAVYAPSWICQMLGATGGEYIELNRVYPVTGNTITIKPHTSAYTQLEDPAAELRNAFERYSCIQAGIDIPLLVGGETLIVSVIDNGFGEPICIRGIELSVEIATALDEEAATALAEEEARVATAAALAEEEALAATALAAKVVDTRFPGKGRRLCDGAVTFDNGVTVSPPAESSCCSGSANTVADTRFPGISRRLG